MIAKKKGIKLWGPNKLISTSHNIYTTISSILCKLGGYLVIIMTYY